MSTPDAEVTSPGSNLRLRGGLLAPDHGHMPSLFTLTIVWSLVSLGALVIGPYLAHRHQDSYWTAASTIFFWSCISAVSTLHGFLVYLTCHRSGFSAWTFLVGALPGTLATYLFHVIDVNPYYGTAIFPLSFLVMAFLSTRKPQVMPLPATGALRFLDRIAFLCGNIWWGIGQLAVILVILARATVYESQVGGQNGNEAAYVAYYNSNWFGGLCLLFFVTLYCATMRKYPFRISQSGWLCVHAGLLGMLIGCMVMFWGSYEGRMQLFEGQTSSEVKSSRQREIVVSIPTANVRETFLLSADLDPTRHDVHQSFSVSSQGKTYKFTIDQYLADAEYYTELVDHGGGGEEGHDHQHAHEAGVEVEINPGRRSEILLENSNPEISFGALFAVFLQRFPNERSFKGFTHRYRLEDKSRGKLIVRALDGKVLAEMPITPGKRDQDPSLGAAVEGAEATIPERQLSFKVSRYYDQFSTATRRGIFDATPGSPQMPGLLIEVGSARGLHRFAALANGQYGCVERSQTDPPNDIILDYECTPEFSVQPNSMTIAIGPGADQPSMVIVDKAGGVRIEPFEEGKSYRLSEDAPISVTPKVFYENATVRSGFRATKENGFKALHLIASSDGELKQTWLVCDVPQQTDTVAFGNTNVEVSYKSLRRDLGFSLSCLDFREFRYPNSTKPKAFESNVVLRDPAAGVDELSLIDMNHPLDYKGFRVFNSSPIHDEKNNRRGVVFQITRNPGYGIIIVNCIIVTIGLVTVFFFKPALKRIEQRRTAARLQSSAANAPKSAVVPQGA